MIDKSQSPQGFYLTEALRALMSAGWVKIRHGKPTVVNDYWQKGGLGLLSTLAKYGEYLPNGFITHLLEVRATLLPPVARFAAEHHPQVLKHRLARSTSLSEPLGGYRQWRPGCGKNR